MHTRKQMRMNCETSGCSCSEQGLLIDSGLEVENCSSTMGLVELPGSLKDHDWVSEDTVYETTMATPGVDDDHCSCYQLIETCRNSSFPDSASSVESLVYDEEDTNDQSNIFTSQMQLPNKCKDGPQLGHSYASKVEELQLDLLECALENEVKILELKMQMVHMQSQADPAQSSEADITLSQSSNEQVDVSALPCGKLEKMLSQRLDTCKKKMGQLQGQRDSLTKELSEFRKKQRRYEMQRRNMEELLRRVNNLQRKLVKKEEEMVECQLKEKEARARLHEVQMALQRSKTRNFEPEQLIKLIPSIRSWLRSLKKTVPIKNNQRQLLQVEQFEAVLGRILESAPPELFKRPNHRSTRKMIKDNVASNIEHSSPVDCIKEVYALQKELQRLAAHRT